MNSITGSDPSWDGQQAFLAVLEEGSLSAAARRLAITQPTVRARVAALETALGTVLFTRSANGMVPTAQAEALAGHVRAMQRASDALVRSASGEPGVIAGTVRISMSEFVGIEVLPPMLSDLRQDHPALRLELDLSNRNANLLEQEVDVAVRNSPPQQQALVASKVAAIPLGLFAHERYLADRKNPARDRRSGGTRHHRTGSGTRRARTACAATARTVPGEAGDQHGQPPGAIERSTCRAWCSSGAGTRCVSQSGPDTDPANARGRHGGCLDRDA